MTTTNTPRPPYDTNHATLPAEETQNARNLGGDKETIERTCLVVFSQAERSRIQKRDAENGWRSRGDEGFRTVVDARFYMGRSGSASTVYCSIWVHTKDGKGYSGHGKAGGYGYHKQSAALADAIRSAGIKLAGDPSGCGDSAMRHAMEAIARAAGYSSRTPMTII